MRRIRFFPILLILLCSCKGTPHRIYAKDELKINIGEDELWQRAVRKFSLQFNTYRKANDIPLLPDNFYFGNGGLDLVEWRSADETSPGLVEKAMCWMDGEPSLIWDQSIYKGLDEQRLVFRYMRKDSDSFLINYSKLDPAFKKEKDTFYYRIYYHVDLRGVRKSVKKNFYDSVMKSWGISPSTVPGVQ